MTKIFAKPSSPRKRGSRFPTFFKVKFTAWIPAFAGMTNLYCTLSITVPQPASAYDPFKDQFQRPQPKEDPEKLSRPTTTHLKGAEIKEFRDKLNAAKTLIFKEGAAPGGSRFRAKTEDPAGNSFTAETPLGRFKESVQTQIVSKLPEAQNSSRALVVDVTVDGNNVTVGSVQFAQSALNIPTTQTRAESLAKPASVAPLRSESSQVSPVRIDSPKSKVAQVGPSVPAALPTAPLETGKQIGMGVTLPTKGADVIVSKGIEKTAQTEMTQIVKQLAAEGGVVRTPAVLEPIGQSVSADRGGNAAIIPIAGGSAFKVTSIKESKADSTVRVQALGPADDLPPAITNQIKNDLPRAAQTLPKKGEVAIVMEIRPGNKISVVSVTPVESAANQDGARAPEALSSGSDSELVGAAKTLAAFIGMDPKSVSIENPSAQGATTDRRSPAVVMALPSGGEVSVREIGTGAKTGKTVYQAEAKFSDLSTETKNQLKDTLAAFGGSALINDESRVQFDFTVQKPGEERTITQITVENDAQDQQLVLLFKSGEPAADKPAGPPDSDSGVQTQRPSPTGLAPAVARVIQTGFGFQKGQFSVQDLSVKGVIRIAAGKGKGFERKDISLAWIRNPVASQYVFKTEKKALDFSDEVRDAIYAKLKKAVENGETWATEALNGKKAVAVEFAVTEDGSQLEMLSVSQPPKDAAVDLAHSMGLKDGDFLLVNVGEQLLVALEAGKTATIQMGEKTLRLQSPDGDAKIFLKQNRAKKDQSILLMLSRETLEANRNALVRLTGKDSAQLINQALISNLKTDQFLVRTDPNEDETLVIRPASSLSENEMLNHEKK